MLGGSDSPAGAALLATLLPISSAAASTKASLSSPDASSNGLNISGLLDELAASVDSVSSSLAEGAGAASAAMTAQRPASTLEVDGALSIGKTAGRLVNVVVGVAALQLVKGLSGTVLQQVSALAEQRRWLHVFEVMCWLSAWAHEQYERRG
jgi:hypothetical protein